MNSIVYTSLNSEQLYIYDSSEKPVSKIAAIKYYLYDKKSINTVKLNKIFMVIRLQENFKPSTNMDYFIKLPCKSFSYCYLDLNKKHSYQEDKLYGIEVLSFNSIEDFLIYKEN